MRYRLAAALGLFAASAVEAGVLDRSGQPVTTLFEPGNRIEAGMAVVVPDVQGVDAAGTRTGNTYDDYPVLTLGLKRDFGARWSGALLIDEPWAVDVDYGPSSLVFGGTAAAVASLEVTALARYRVSERWSLHAGPRLVQFGGDVGLGGAAFGPLAGYQFTADDAWGLGYAVGGAFEMPEIALRVALTYGSEVGFDVEAEENFFGDSKLDITMPQSVNLDFQTGIAADTLLFGSIRWVDWSGWTVAPQGLLAATGQPLVAYAEDSVTYKLGVGRSFGDHWDGMVQVAHEPSTGKPVSALGPYDGFTSLTVGGSWKAAGGGRVSAGVEYIWPGDAEVVSGGGTASFEGNSGMALGLRLSLPM